MKILTGKDNLLYAVQIVQKAVSLKNPLPILSGILLKAEDNILKVIGTDLEISIECSVPVTVVEEGSVVLPAKYLSEIVKKLPDTKVEISSEENNSTNIKYGSSKFKIKNMTSEDFPLISFSNEGISYSINENLFKNMIKQVVFATSTDETRPVFTGVLLEIENNAIKLVASDTHRLALRTAYLNENYEQESSVIIPGRSLKEISRIISDEDTEISISINENQILFEKENIRLTSRLIQGQFPNYNQIIPQNFHSHLTVNNREFLDSIERAALLAREINNAVKIEVFSDTLKLSSNSPDIGQIDENIPSSLDGEETEIAFNSKYLLDALKVIDCEDIKVSLTGSLSPGIIKPTTNNNYIYLILPVRTN